MQQKHNLSLNFMCLYHLKKIDYDLRGNYNNKKIQTKTLGRYQKTRYFFVKKKEKATCITEGHFFSSNLTDHVPYCTYFFPYEPT